MSPRTGRPKTGNAKEVVIRCRISKELNAAIEDFCQKNNVTKTDVMIQGIKKVIKK